MVNVCLARIPERKNRENGGGAVHKEIMATVPELMNPQIK